MLVLVATNELQGLDPDDHAHTVEGELVALTTTECDDSACGCGRSFLGLASSRATTTAMVVDRPAVTEGDLRDAIRDSLERDGWRSLLEFDGTTDAEIDAMLDEIVDEHVELIEMVCRHVAAGTVISRTARFVSARGFPDAA